MGISLPQSTVPWRQRCRAVLSRSQIPWLLFKTQTPLTHLVFSKTFQRCWRQKPLGVCVGGGGNGITHRGDGITHGGETAGGGWCPPGPQRLRESSFLFLPNLPLPPQENTPASFQAWGLSRCIWAWSGQSKNPGFQDSWARGCRGLEQSCTKP